MWYAIQIYTNEHVLANYRSYIRLCYYNQEQFNVHNHITFQDIVRTSQFGRFMNYSKVKGTNGGGTY